MYAYLPLMVPAWVRLELPWALAMPKSTTLAMPALETRMLSGETSL
ncbi:MAG: hypothetical protein QM765_29375 [Myxococcales bacterium]